MILTTKQRRNGWYLIIDKMHLETYQCTKVFKTKKFYTAWAAINAMKKLATKYKAQLKNPKDSSISFEHDGYFYAIRGSHKKLESKIYK